MSVRQDVQSNAVFLAVSPAVASMLQREWGCYLWDEAQTIVRVMTAFDTSPADVAAFLASLREMALARLRRPGPRVRPGRLRRAWGACPRPGGLPGCRWPAIRCLPARQHARTRQRGSQRRTAGPGRRIVSRETCPLGG